jgi:hypothetical protein
MKRTLIILIVGLLAVGCGKTELTEEEKLGQADADVSIPTTNTNEVDGTTVKPVKELTPELKQQKALRDSVVGEYEFKEDENTGKLVLLKNGIGESYINGKKEVEGKWKITNGEIHVDEKEVVRVYGINKDRSIAEIAYIVDGKRTDWPIEEQSTFKKIK